MATSSSTDFSMTRNEIIEDALHTLTVLGSEEALQDTDLAIGTRALNRLIKHWENKAIHIWKRTEALLFVQAGQSKYTLGTGMTDHCTETYVSTTLSANAAASASSITVTSTTGMTVGDYIGILLDSGSFHWTTISAIPSTVTLTTALPSAAASGKNVFTYTTNIAKPLNIYNARRYNMTSELEIMMTELAYDDYMNLPNKNTDSGTEPLNYMYNRNLNTGDFYIWPQPQTVGALVKLTYAKPIQDFDNATDTPDLPQEWYDAIVLNLAVKLAHVYGKASGDSYNALKLDAMEALNDALSFDNDLNYVKFVIDMES